MERKTPHRAQHIHARGQGERPDSTGLNRGGGSARRGQLFQGLLVLTERPKGTVTTQTWVGVRVRTRAHAHTHCSHTHISFWTPATAPDKSPAGKFCTTRLLALVLSSAGELAGVFLSDQHGLKLGSRAVHCSRTFPKLASTSFVCLFSDKIKSNFYLDIIFFPQKVIRTLLFIQYWKNTIFYCLNSNHHPAL